MIWFIKPEKKILYDPYVVVYHHRRPIFIKHLQQISRYGLHRGYFVKYLPKTSLRLGYFLPLLFVMGIISVPLLVLTLIMLSKTLITTIISDTVVLIAGLYAIMLIANALWVTLKSRNMFVGFLTIPTIVLSHFIYGLYFGIGLTKKEISQ